MSALASRIRAARAYAGLKQIELADLLELGAMTYKRTELGQREVPRRELLAIAEACEVPMWFLEGGWEGRGEGQDTTSIDHEGHDAVQDLSDREGRKAADA
jgi:transcriptional regulator with XRE-family HTH domain